jgi:type II secretory pathway predicted ATPase ExeA
MYLDYWKLERRPFDERIDPQWFFPSGAHQGMWMQMRAIVERRHAVAILAGGVGAGKSMVAATLAEHFSDTHMAITVGSPCGTSNEVFQRILDELQRTSVASNEFSYRDFELADPSQLVKQQLARRVQAGQRIVAFVDAADHLPPHEFGELLGKLHELQAGNSCEMTTFVIGSPELLVRFGHLLRAGGRQAPQSILGSMAPTDSALYVRFRMQRAGGDPGIFTPEAIERIHDLSGGIPRRINRLCDVCLLVGYSKGCEVITDGVVWSAQPEIRLLAPSRTAAAPPTRRWRPMQRATCMTHR